MFVITSEIYDLVYSFKDYRKEADHILHQLRQHAPDCQSVLDVGCGTGEHHKFLKDEYQLDGLDINADFVTSAEKKNPQGRYFTVDMTDFDIDHKYDVIICLFSSIGYAKSIDKVISTLKSCYRHLKARGLVLVEPWLTPDRFTEGRMDLLTYETDDIKISRMNESRREGQLSTIDFQFLIGRKGYGIEHYIERHELGLFSVEEMTGAFEEAGFSVSFEEAGFMDRGLYIGRN